MTAMYFSVECYFQLTFSMNSYNKSQRDAKLSQIYLLKYSTCFGHTYSPSSGVYQHCIQAVGICHASSVAFC